MIGIFAGILGIGSAFLLIPYFIPTVTWQIIFITGLGIDTIFLTFVFSIFIAVITSYLPARRAAKIPTAEAIREYTLAGEPTGYNRFAAWSLLILGSYKLVVWLLGLNVGELAIQLIFSNPLLGSLSIYWVLFDAFMNFWGPLFFLWGLTTLLVKGWKGFYRASQNFIGRILGDLGGLASHNIQRRPGRTVAIIFMTALLVGYGVQTIGVLSSSHDVAIREAYRTVGADLDVLVSTPTNVSDLLPTIRGIQGVKGAAEQFTFDINTVSTSISVRAINVSEWTGVGYFEQNWFSSVPASVALNALVTDNESIILERKIAVELDVNVDEIINIQIGALPFIQLNINGFFGPEPLITQGFFGGVSIEAEKTWSYMSTEFMWDHFFELSPTGHILVALDSPLYNNEVKQAIEALDDVLQVKSAATLIEQYNTDVLRNSTTNMMQMGVFFAFGLASIGTLVIIYLTLRERRTTTALMSARGMTYTQTAVILMAETLTMMVFAIFIGFLVGLTIYYGLISGGAGGTPQLVEPLFLPPAFLGMFSLQNGILVGLLLLTTLIPILVEARVARYDLSVLR
jgi:ABC-type antimicrobial peptide transport system permease subunit